MRFAGRGDVKMIARAEAAGLDLVSDSDRNLVAFYAEELRDKRFGEIPGTTRRVMRLNYGLLQLSYGHNKNIVCTDKCLRILEALDHE